MHGPHWAAQGGRGQDTPSPGQLRRCESCTIRKTETDGSSGTKAFRMRSRKANTTQRRVSGKHTPICRVFCVSFLTASETQSLHVRHQPIYTELSTQLNTQQASPTDSFTLLSTQKHNTRRRPQNGKGLGTCYSAAYMSRLKTSSALQSRKWQLIDMS